MIVDTDFIIDVMNGHEGAIARAKQMDRDGVPQRVPGPVVFELFIGVGYNDRPREEIAKIEAVIDSKPYVPMTESIARKAGRITGQLNASGDAVGIGDAMIGASAVVLDEPVLTGNVDDFERIPSVDVVTY